MITLRLPREDEEPEFIRAHVATSPGAPTFLHGYREGMLLREYLGVLAERAKVGQPDGAHGVPTTFLFAFRGPRIVGRVTIRHCLTAALQHEGGHIGYVVVPEFRRQGVATEIIRQAIPIARERSGETRLLVTCDEDNIGSIRTIERNGGVLDDIVQCLDRSARVRRYWIDTSRMQSG